MSAFSDRSRRSLGYVSSQVVISATTLGVTPTVEYLIIAGGGGGSNGGGAAGNYKCSVTGESTGGGGSAEAKAVVSPNVAYTVTVGAGGAFIRNGCVASTGGSSVFDQITATGGTGASSTTGGSSNTFSAAVGDNTRGAGGSGASAAGSAGTTDNGGNGGNGLSSSITGSAVTRGGGGGGAGASARGNGGTGGGGQGAYGSAADATAGTANTGGGGGGQWFAACAQSGGSGIVILRYPDSYALAQETTGSPTVTTTGGYRIYSFTGSGTITF